MRRRIDPKSLVFEALALGKKPDEAAKIAGVSRRTAYRIKAEWDVSVKPLEVDRLQAEHAAKTLGVDTELRDRLNLPDSDWVGRLDGILSKGCEFAEKSFQGLDPGKSSDVKAAAEMIRAIGTLGVNWKLALVKVAEFTKAKKDAENRASDDAAEMSDEELLELAREALSQPAQELQ